MRYTEFVGIYGAKGLAWIKLNDIAKGREGMQSPIVKNLSDAALKAVVDRSGAKKRRPDVLRRGKDQGRQRRARRPAREDRPREGPRGKRLVSPLWVVDFPMFEYDEEAKRWNAMHHPFTAPKEGHEDLLARDPGAALAKAYDMVLNGSEIGGGSVADPPRGGASPRCSGLFLSARRKRGRSSISARGRCNTARRRTEASPSVSIASSL